MMPPGRDTVQLALWVALPLLLVFMGVAMYTSASQESVVWDEAGHVAHGYDYLINGNFWFDQVHAPLPRLAAGLPLLLIEPRVPTEHPAYRGYDFLGYRKAFLFENRVSPDRIILTARMASIAATLLLAVVIALWMRSKFGALAAIIAAGIFALEPNILAYGHYANSEILTALLFFSAVIAWAGYLERRQWRLLLLAGVLTGLAMAAKTSMLFLAGLLPLLAAVRWWQRPREHTLARLLVALLVIGALAVMTIGAVYWPVTKSMIVNGALPMADHVDTSTPAGESFHWLASTFHLPYHPYLMSYYWIAKTGENPNPAYLLGEVSSEGWWHYFIVALLVKGATGFLLGLFVSVGALAGSLVRRNALERLRKAPFAWYTILVPAVTFLGLALVTHISTGMRQMIPIYPFLICIAGAVLGGTVHEARLRKLRAGVVSAVAALLIIESALAFPNYLAFFNLPSGGSGYGNHYVTDSSFDWGQDLKRLAAYADREPIEPLCLAYFGMDSPEYRGLQFEHLRPDATPDQLDCVAAVSATFLTGLHVQGGNYGWLSAMEPFDKIGYTIYLYDLRKRQ